VSFRGCDETLPLDPLKLRDVLEREMLLAAQHGAPSRLAIRVRRMCFVTGDQTPEQGIWEPKSRCARYLARSVVPSNSPTDVRITKRSSMASSFK
jgi:hypothetical protein